MNLPRLNIFACLVLAALGALCISPLLTGTPVIQSAETASVAGSRKTVRYQQHEKNVLLLHAEETASAFGWESKIVTPNKLLTLCRNENEPGGVCIPIRLEKRVVVDDSSGLFIEANLLARALRFTVENRGQEVILTPDKLTSADDDPDLPAYNATWGRGRGFRVGQTVPDIPLYDLKGNEVRFSQFLGKQYILYCWASW